MCTRVLVHWSSGLKVWRTNMEDLLEGSISAVGLGHADRGFTNTKRNQTQSSSLPWWLCSSSLREVCPNCLQSTAACCKGDNPVSEAVGCHLTSAITRFNHLEDFVFRIMFPLQEKNKTNVPRPCSRQVFVKPWLFLSKKEHFGPKISGEHQKSKHLNTCWQMNDLSWLE